jgi:hypothetical protein
LIIILVTGIKRHLPPSEAARDDDEPAEKVRRVDSEEEDIYGDDKPERPLTPPTEDNEKQNNDAEAPKPALVVQKKPFFQAFKNPLSTKAKIDKEEPDESVKTYWTVLYCKHSAKKHKTYSDGTLR